MKVCALVVWWWCSARWFFHAAIERREHAKMEQEDGPFTIRLMLFEARVSVTLAIP